MRLYSTDNLLITARDSDDGPVLAAARIPVGRIRIPFRFRLSSKNAILPTEWERALRESDVIVSVVSCTDAHDNVGRSLIRSSSERDNFPPCPSHDGNQLTSSGIAKLLLLENTRIRAPVSLPLE